MMNELIREIMRSYNVSKDEAITMCLEEYEDSGMDVEDSLYNLGFELDYAFQFFDIVSNY